MRLGFSYMVFDGSELLESAVAAVRRQVDFISVVYQTTSYFGNPADDWLVPTVERLEKQGLIDRLVRVEPDLKVHHKVNELNYRNFGLSLSKEAGCTHHASLDVDEFYKADELAYAKGVVGDEDFTVVRQDVYFKNPAWQITPSQNLLVSFIHPVDNEYRADVQYPTFPFHMETTRRFGRVGKWRLFRPDEVTVHHMSYVRRDIRRKLANSDNGRFFKRREKFFSDFDKYEVGGRVCLLPDFMNRKTKDVGNFFGVEL